MTVLENVQVGMHCRTKSGAFRALFKSPFRNREEKEITEKSLEILEFLALTDYQ